MYRYFTKRPVDAGPFGLDKLYVAVEQGNTTAQDVLERDGWERITTQQLKALSVADRRKLLLSAEGTVFIYYARPEFVGMQTADFGLADIARGMTHAG